MANVLLVIGPALVFIGNIMLVKNVYNLRKENAKLKNELMNCESMLSLAIDALEYYTSEGFADSGADRVAVDVLEKINKI